MDMHGLSSMSTHDTAQCHEVSQSKGCGALETQSGPSEGPKTSPATSARDKSNFDVGASAASASSGASTASIGGPAGSPPPSATTKSMELAGATKSSGRLTDAWYMRGMGLCMCMCACVHVCIDLLTCMCTCSMSKCARCHRQGMQFFIWVCSSQERIIGRTACNARVRGRDSDESTGSSACSS